MKKFVVYEQANYEVEAESASEAIKKFLAGNIKNFPCEVTDRYVTAEGSDWIEPVDPDTGEEF